MSELTCFIGSLRRGLSAPGTLALDGKPIEKYFREASRIGRQRPAVDLRFDFSRASRSILGDEIATDTYYLNERLGRLIDIAPEEAGPSRAVGLIFADCFELERDLAPAQRRVFGMMFDRAFVHPNDLPVRSPRIYSNVPRQGCAVFVDTIRQRRIGEDVDAELMRTAIHELGHVFNLWHLSTPLNFMAPASHFESLTAKQRLDGYTFVNGSALVHQQQSFLSQCGFSRHVTPGQADYGDRDSIGPPFAQDNARSLASPSRAYRKSVLAPIRDGCGLKLRIAMSDREFRTFDPVELDVQLSLAKSAPRRLRVRDRLDPAYEDFQIFIEQPDGTRKRYRPPKYICGPEVFLENLDNKAFQRDISIFGQAGGYTFEMAGPHRIQIQFRLGPTRTLWSNIIDVFVRPTARKASTMVKDQDVLTDSSVARLLFYRSAPRRSLAWQRINAAREALHRSMPGAMLTYCAAHALGKLARRARRTDRNTLRNRAAELFSRAADDDFLGLHRRKKALQCRERIR